MEIERKQLAGVDYQKASEFSKQKVAPDFAYFRFCFKSKVLSLRVMQNFAVIRSHVLGLR